MGTRRTYRTREIETMLCSKQGQAKLRSIQEQTRLLPIDFLSEDGAPESAQQILEQIKNQARQEAAEILAQQKIPSLPQEPVARFPRQTTRIRRGVIVACLLLLFCCFWITEPGIAVAHYLQKIIATWQGGVLNIGQTMPQDGLINELNYADAPETFSSLEEAAEYLQRPVAVVQHEALTLDTIEVYIDEPAGILLWSTYALPNGAKITTRQYFYDPSVGAPGSSILLSEQAESYTLPNDAILYYGPDGFGEANGLAVWPYGELSISGDIKDISTLRNFIETIVFINP